MEKKLLTTLDIIAEKAERRGAVLLSEIKEWDDELQAYSVKTYGHWSGVIENGELRLGRLLHRLLEYKHYNPYSGEEYKPVPYHCYAITPDDVLFVNQELEWDEEKGEYAGIMAETFRNMSWKIKHPKEYAELEAINKQLEDAKAKKAQKSSSGCMVVIMAMIASIAFMFIGAFLFV